MADRRSDTARSPVGRRRKPRTTGDPAQANRKANPSYDKDLYEAHHLIENFFCWLKQFRAIAARYDKRDFNFLAGVYAASSLIPLD